IALVLVSRFVIVTGFAPVTILKYTIPPGLPLLLLPKTVVMDWADAAAAHPATTDKTRALLVRYDIWISFRVLVPRHRARPRTGPQRSNSTERPSGVASEPHADKPYKRLGNPPNDPAKIPEPADIVKTDL